MSSKDLLSLMFIRITRTELAPRSRLLCLLVIYVAAFCVITHDPNSQKQSMCHPKEKAVQLLNSFWWIATRWTDKRVNVNCAQETSE